MRTQIQARLSAARRRSALREFHLARRIGRRLGYDVLPASFYSPVPDTGALPQSVWDEPSPMPGVELDLEAQVEMLESELAEYLREFSPPADPPGNREGFYLTNPFYGPADAALLYAMVRRHRPRRVLELGSGFSTLVIAGARARNDEEGGVQDAEHRVVDPYPSPVLDAVRERIELQPTSAAELPLEQFAALEAGDILFVDTSHTLKPGSEVLYLLLEALPALRPGVIVHIHDVFRPFEYPRLLYDTYGNCWQEHYLVQAFLAFNREYEIVCAAHAIARLHGERLRELVPLHRPDHPPSGFWLRRVATPH